VSQLTYLKERYPSYRTLSDVLRTYTLTLKKITPEIEILSHGYVYGDGEDEFRGGRSEVQKWIQNGVLRTNWTIPVKVQTYATSLGQIIQGFENFVDSLLKQYRELQKHIEELRSCPATPRDFENALKALQRVVNDMTLEDNDNGEVWMNGFRDQVDDVLRDRLRGLITEWIENVERLGDGGSDKEVRVGGAKQIRSSHKIAIKQRGMYLQPPLNMARYHWLGQLQEALQVITKQMKIKTSTYTTAWDTGAGDGDDSSMIYLMDVLQPELKIVQGVIEREIKKAQENANTWMRYQQLWAGTQDDVMSFMSETHKDDLTKWLGLLRNIRSSRDDLDNEDSASSDSAITIDSEAVANKVMSKYDDWHKQLLKTFAEKILDGTDSWYEKVNKARDTLEKFAIETGDTMEAIKFLNAVENFKMEKPEWGAMVVAFTKGEKLLLRERTALPQGWKYAQDIENEWNTFSQIFEKRSAKVEEEKPKLQMKILSQDDEIEVKVKALIEEWNEAALESEVSLPAKEIAAKLVGFDDKLEGIDESYSAIAQAKKILGLDSGGQSNKLDNIKESVAGLKNVWASLTPVRKELDDVRETSWNSVQPRKVLGRLKEFVEQMDNMGRGLRQYEAWNMLKGTLQSYVKVDRMLLILRSESLKDRHWQNLRDKMDLPGLDYLNLGQVYDADLNKHKDLITKTQVQAQGEMALEEFLKTTRDIWEDFELELVQYQSKTRLIRGWDDLFTKLGESISSLKSMAMSPYYKVFEAEGSAWEDKLNKLNERFDIWVDVQRRWVYLETIFLGSQEIKYQLPQEHRRFMQIDKDFRDLQREVSKNPKALEILKIDQILERVQNLQDMLVKIQKALGDYLEKQRQGFARFYFVGDEDLLELIGSAKDPVKVQKHFSKMFAGISSLEIEQDGEGESAVVRLTGMSSQGFLETIMFKKHVNVSEDPKINVWLGKLEAEMKESLATYAHEALLDLRSIAAKCTDPTLGFSEQTQPFFDWCAQYPCQCAQLMLQTQWTEATEEALKEVAATKSNEALEKCLRGVEASLTMLAGQVLIEPSVLQRMKFEAMITELVHQRTVLRDLLSRPTDDVLHPDHFAWLYYMRFYWNDATKDIVDQMEIKMADSVQIYGWEYQGVVERLVQTPLSDRAYLTLTQALHMRLGGMPYGPAGTGKTETVKALGTQLGRYVLVFCCDENFDMHAMGRIFIGLCQVGAWGCFDEFNRLAERELSACSQQIQTIQEGLLTGAETIELLGRTLKPHTNTGIFCTMNPGYAGRSELPDNLKQLLRACAMTAPDRELIAEVMLYAQGFSNAEPLSQKIVPLFNLCRDQLSAQPHYDFGLRALKSVLRSAGNIKRSLLVGLADEDRAGIQTLVAEQELVMRSIKETVAPKLVGLDISLLLTLMTDVFPGVKQEDRVFPDLVQAIQDIAKERNYECTETWLLKVLQLYQIQFLNHGFMVVGPTANGKTSCWSVLLEAMGRLEGGREGRSYVIDPKSMTKEELYGEIDDTTREWTDGVFTKILRKVIDETKSQPMEQSKTTWIVFDGDVDAVWVENLNSVLDDNKLLTLPNGERLALLDNIRIVFEVQDLNHATPATVSRCGMVWFSDNTVTIDMIVGNYLEDIRTIPLKLGDGMDDENKQMQVQKKCADVLAKKIKGEESILIAALAEAQTKFTIMDFVPMQCCTAYFALLNMGIQKILDFNGSNEEFPLDDAIIEKYLNRHLLRSLVWACGGSMRLDDRLQLGRDLISMSDEDVPESLGNGESAVSLVELDCNVKDGEWVPWRTMIPEQSIPASKVGASDVVITTEDTVRHVDTLTAWLLMRRPLLLCGPPGSGKTMTLMSTLKAHPELECVALNFSSTTDPELIMKVMDQYCVTESAPGGKGLIMRPKQMNKWVVMFCDECNLPQADEYGTQRVISFIRQLVEKNGFWRPSDGQFITLERVQFLGACNPPTDPGREPLTHRFLRWAPLLLVDYPAVPSMKLIYGVFNKALLERTPVGHLAEASTNAMVETYEKSRLRFTADMQPHYIYSPRELTRWVRALREGLEGHDAITELELARLVYHEGLRLFRDRLVTPAEQQWLDKSIDEIFCTHYSSIDTNAVVERPVLFSTWLTKQYREVGQEELRALTRARLKTFADEELDVKLVVFNSVLEHVLRIDRIIKQPSGHMMLAGASGAGKTILSRFVSWMNNVSVFTLKVHRNYGVEEFDEDLRGIMRRSGLEDEKICFIIDESNCLSSAFLEKMNALLASAEVPGLFEGEELSQLMRQCAEKFGTSLTTDELYDKFVHGVSKNLHIIFTMNPVGDDFSSRAATSPALFNRCVVDWFGDWDKQAYEQVAEELTAHLDLDNTEDGEAGARAGVINSFVHFHSLMRDTSNDMAQATGRANYITPRHFIDCIEHYKVTFLEKREALEAQQLHLNKGLTKLKQTEEDVQKMQEELAVKNKELADAGIAAEEKLKLMLVDQQEAKEKKETSETLAVEVKAKQDVIDARKEEATAELATVEPAIAEAKLAVGGIQKSHLDEVRALAKPPDGVRITMEAVCILLGKGKQPWPEIRKIIREKDFISSVMNFDSEAITDAARKALAPYNKDPNFTYEKVQKSSRAAAPLCKWGKAQITYSTVLAKAEPLRAEVRALEADASGLITKYKGLVATAKEAEERVEILKQEYSVLIGEKARLEETLKVVKSKAERAVSLLGNLSVERDRWAEQKAGFQAQMATVPGDALFAAAFLAYIGYFNEEMRRRLMLDLRDHLEELHVPLKENLAITEYLSTPDKRLQWSQNALPADDLCVDNAIMIERFIRYPLIIDPSGQAVDFIMNQYKGIKVQKTSFLDESFAKVLEAAVRFGTGILIQDVESMDPILNPLLNKEYVKKGGRVLVRVGENEIDFSPAFQMFMATRDATAHFAPDLCSRVTFVNFTVTPSSLQAQVLGELLRSERPDIQKKQEELLKLQGEFQAKLLQLERDLLDTLNAAEGNILDDNSVIKKMEFIKKEANEVQEKIDGSKAVQNEVDEVNEFYRNFATACSKMYFLLESLGSLHFLYQFSLNYFLEIFGATVKGNSLLDGVEDKGQRLSIMINDIFGKLYRNVIRGLLQNDKMVFAFRLGQVKLQGKGEDVKADEFGVFLKGAMQPKPDVNIPTGMLNEEQEIALKQICSLECFSDLEAQMSSKADEWTAMLKSGEPEVFLTQDGPLAGWEGKDAGANHAVALRRVLIIKALRPDRILAAARQWIDVVYDPEFLNLPTVGEELEYIIETKGSLPKSPLLMCNKPGNDASYRVDDLAKKSPPPGGLVSLAMGSPETFGEAEKEVVSQSKRGGWLMLKNVHLAVEWLSSLEKQLHALTPHQDFRIFLTMEFTDKVPPNLVRSSRVFIFEPPSGVIASLRAVS
jgi:dynein heavy chain 1